MFEMILFGDNDDFFRLFSIVGAVIGLISVTIFAVTLRRIEEENPLEAAKALRGLISLVLGGGLSDFVIFDVVYKSREALAYYMTGFAVIFLLICLLVFRDWRRQM